MNDDTTAFVVEIAKTFIAMLQVTAPKWEKGFFRFKSEDDNYGSNASYVIGNEAFLVGALRNGVFFDRANRIGRNLIESFGRTRGMFLLIAENNFDYKIEFEWDDLDRWEITKLDGGTGIPAGL